MKQKNETIQIQMDANSLFNSLLNDYISIKQGMVLQIKRGKIDKKVFLADARKHIESYYVESNEAIDEALQRFEEYIFGYSHLTSLINDKNISDIRCIAYDNIRIKEKGIRKNSDVHFNNPLEYRNFIDFVATKNQVSISNMNAIQRFSDTKSSDEFILRFTITMPLVNTYEEPYLHIRKVPKNFPELADLVQEGMLTHELAGELKKRFGTGSTLICGGNSSGKTTLLNALKETLPEDMSVLIAQQADELTTKRHPDMMFLHSLNRSTESKVEYDLKDISIAGLTMDVDFFIIGEVKGDEAIYVLNAAYTGQFCAATIHGPSADKAIDKLVDYAMYGSRYSKAELMKMMSCFKNIIFMKDYKVDQVYEVTGWNGENEEIEYKSIYERGDNGGIG